jgi:hypothetical protein
MLSGGISLSKPCDTQVESSAPQRDIYQRRIYAAHRAVIAVDRAIRITSVGSYAERDRALRWMKLWMAFAASRYLMPDGSRANTKAA